MGIQETYLAFTAQPQANFRHEVEQVLATLKTHQEKRHFVWLRFHLSDITNQHPILEEVLQQASVAWLGEYVLHSAVGQPPVNGAHCAVEAYLVDHDVTIERQPGLTLLKLEHYTLAYFNSAELSSKGSGPQMAEEFARVEAMLKTLGGTIEDNVQRTWIYCRDIDNNYADLVTARRNLFAEHQLTQETHYIASTGIEATSAVPDRLVRMDTLALLGHQPQQIRYLQALQNLSPTHIYGVTFERATQIVYGDRSHIYVSGTASIDHQGHILHLGDVTRQAERMLDNIEALLEEGGTGLEHLVQAVVYLRDPADAPLVQAVLAKRLPPGIPHIMVRGAVCRPGWLVETDAIAVTPQGDRRFQPLG